MSRLAMISPESATGKAKGLLETVHTRLGMVPNMMRAMSNAPAVLEGYLQWNGALGHGALSTKVREQIALTVAEANGCGYCLAAHSAIGKMVGLSADQIRDSRLGTAVDARTEALVGFARKLVDTRGRVSDDEFDMLRQAAFDDGIIAEVVANVALGIFTNYFNNVADLEVDFPRASALTPAAALSV